MEAPTSKAQKGAPSVIAGGSQERMEGHSGECSLSVPRSIRAHSWLRPVKHSWSIYSCLQTRYRFLGALAWYTYVMWMQTCTRVHALRDAQWCGKLFDVTSTCSCLCVRAHAFCVCYAAECPTYAIQHSEPMHVIVFTSASMHGSKSCIHKPETLPNHVYYSQ